jgi:parvulin-like peptidyl-prolyl isomerase
MAAPAAPPSQPALTAQTVVAEVNGTKITYGELERTVLERVPNVTGHGTISEERLRQRALELLEQMITEELILQEAKRLGIALDRSKVDAEIARQRNEFPSEEKFQEALQLRNMTEQSFRKRIERGVLIQQAVAREVDQRVAVTDQEMADYFREHPEKFVIPTQYRLRLLLLVVDPAAAPEIWERERQRAADFRARVLKGENFEALIRQYSGDDETRDKDGDTGLFHQGQLGLPEIENAVESLKPGEITPPVRTIYGFYLARVEERRPGRQQKFEELNKEFFRQELVDSKRRERSREWIASLRSSATITRLSAFAAAP